MMDASRLSNRLVKIFKICKKIQDLFVPPCQYVCAWRVRNVASAGELWVKNSDIFTGVRNRLQQNVSGVSGEVIIMKTLCFTWLFRPQVFLSHLT